MRKKRREEISGEWRRGEDEGKKVEEEKDGEEEWRKGEGGKVGGFEEAMEMKRGEESFS